MFIEKNKIKAMFVASVIAITSSPVGAVDWIMASGYPDSNFMTKKHKRIYQRC
jgi:hypothetical protein